MFSVTFGSSRPCAGSAVNCREIVGFGGTSRRSAGRGVVRVGAFDSPPLRVNTAAALKISYENLANIVRCR